MRRLRLIILILAIIVIAAFAASTVYEYRTTDSTAPVIHADTDTLFLSVNATEEDLLAGMSAYDNLDGDVTNTIVVVSRSKFITKGTQRVNYAAFDKNNNVAVYYRTVTYTDYESPRFSVSQPLRFLSGSASYNYLRGITVQDSLDGDITQKVKVTYGDVEAISDAVSFRALNLLVTNSAGDSSVLPMNVTFENNATYTTKAPALRNYVLYTTTETKPDLRGNLCGFWAGGKVTTFEDNGIDPADSVSINDSGADYNVPGFYTVTYTLTRLTQEGIRTNLGSATLIVVVEEKK